MEGATQKRRIAVITGNRADYSRLKSVLKAIVEHPELELQLVVIGSHLLEKYGNTVKDIERDGFPIDYRIHMEIAGESLGPMTKSVGLGIVELATYFTNKRPDVVIVPVDRFESMSMAVSAALMNLPIAHIQGGEITGTIDESIRHAITKMSHIHFPATEPSRQRIIKLGEPEETVFNVGCPGSDLLAEAPVLNREQALEAANAYIKIDTLKLDVTKPYLLMVQHPVTTEFGSGFAQINETLMAASRTGLQCVMLWPNIDAGSDDISRGIRMFQLEHKDFRLPILKHMSNDTFINLIRNAECMVGNSSSGIREACYFGTPVVDIGTRQMSRERSENVVWSDYKMDEIEQKIKTQMAHGKYAPNYLYGDGTAGKQIAEILSKIDISKVQKKLTF